MPTPFLIQGFVRTMDEPILEFAVLRDLVALAQNAKAMLQLIQLRMPEENAEAFKKAMVERLSHYFTEAHISVIVREGVHLWVVGTGDCREEHGRAVERVQTMPYPFALEDPQ